MTILFRKITFLLLALVLSLSACDSLTSPTTKPKPTTSTTDSKYSGNPVTKVLLDMQTKEADLQAKIDGSSDQFGDEEAMFKLDEQQQKMNATHLEELGKMLDTHGWISPEKYGEAASLQALSILRNAPGEKLEKHLDIVINAYENGTANPADAAYIHDKVLMYQGQEQLYGTQIAFNPEKGINDVYPIKDETNVNERRKKMGLGNLEDALKKMGIQYEVPQ